MHANITKILIYKTVYSVRFFPSLTLPLSLSSRLGVRCDFAGAAADVGCSYIHFVSLICLGHGDYLKRIRFTLMLQCKLLCKSFWFIFLFPVREKKNISPRIVQLTRIFVRCLISSFSRIYLRFYASHSLQLEWSASHGRAVMNIKIGYSHTAFVWM